MSIDYCRNFLRDHDYNKYLLTFFAPRAVRNDVIAIFALNAELESIPTKIKDPNIAFIRLKWWEDQIDAVYQGQDHASSPVMAALRYTIQNHDIPQSDFEPLIACYDEILRGTPRDPDDSVYALCAKTLRADKEKIKFSKVLQHHDNLPDHVRFRALRLWLGV